MASNDNNTRMLEMIIETQAARLNEQDATIKDLRATIEGLRSTVDDLRSIKANLEETLEEFRRQFFGVRSEKTSRGGKADDDSADNNDNNKTEIQVKAHKRVQRKPKSTRGDMYAGLPIVEELCPVSEDQKRCAWCGAEMVPMGLSFVREELRITPARVERVHYMQEVYICPECRKDGDGTIVKGEAPLSLIPHSPASASAVAYTMFDKCFMGIPYYRMESAFSQLGARIPRETLANWCIISAEKYLYPIYDILHTAILGREIIHADETTTQVLREEGKPAQSTSYMWIYRTGSDGLPGIVLYQYQPGRGGIHPREFLKGFKGMLQCDGYTGYNSVEDVILVCCMAHCRRKFYEALPADRKKTLKLLDINSDEEIKEPVIPEKDLDKYIPAEIGVAYCNKLFYLERQFKGMDPEERKTKRMQTQTQVWDGFWKWLDSLNATKGSKFEKAVNYAQNHRESLQAYMLDGRCELSNNAAEREAKSYAISRKNSLFHTSVAGANASSIIFSIVETAKANNLNVFQYIYMLLLYMPGCIKNGSAGIEHLLPWSDFIKEHCSGLIDVETITEVNHPELPN